MNKSWVFWFPPIQHLNKRTMHLQRSDQTKGGKLWRVSIRGNECREELVFEGLLRSFLWCRLQADRAQSLVMNFCPSWQRRREGHSVNVCPAFGQIGGGQRAFRVSAASWLPSAQNHPSARGACLRVVYAVILHLLWFTKIKCSSHQTGLLIILKRLFFEM